MTEQKKKKIYIGLPVYSGIEPKFFVNFLDLMIKRREGVTLEIETVAGESLVPRARNRLAAMFLKTDCDHLMFLDVDLVFSADSIIKLMQHDDYDIWGGLYGIKNPNRVRWCANRLDGVEVDQFSGMLEVKHLGTGLMLIKRRVLERMRDERPEIAYINESKDGKNEETMWDFFQCGVRKDLDGKMRYFSEDWCICHHAREMGMKTYADTSVLAGHVGSIVYPIKWDMESKKMHQMDANA